MSRSTIAAISTPPGPGSRGVIRVSGARARALVLAVARFGEPPDLSRRGAWRGRFDDGRGEQPLLLLWMPAPHSLTREDVAEFHLSGSPPLLEAALARLFSLGAEPAQPGEFTRRAFESGRLDLTRAEGVLALVEAGNEAERRSASALLFGGLEARVLALRERLEELRTLCEASLDFDESDTGHVPRSELAALAQDVRAGLDAALAWEDRREPLRGSPRVALVGAPNAGKSSLFNRLVDSARALVSAHAGTTRDGVSGWWRVRGVDCRLIDTAGIDREAEDAGAEPDRIAQGLARAERESADLLVWVVDACAADARSLAREADELPDGPRRLLAWNKLDRAEARPPPGVDELARLRASSVVAISALKGSGRDELEARAAGLLGIERERATDSHHDATGIGRELSLRHRHALESSRRELGSALELLERGSPFDQVAAGLRWATDALDSISGRTTPEDLLERIFARFCLGK